MHKGHDIIAININYILTLELSLFYKDMYTSINISLKRNAWISNNLLLLRRHQYTTIILLLSKSNFEPD
jgi:hypothetical protein